jgi:hypothetical protein
MAMQARHAPVMAVQITGPRESIEWALQQGLLPDAHFHAAHGLEWIEVQEISEQVEFEMMCGGCSVHHR